MDKSRLWLLTILMVIGSLGIFSTLLFAQPKTSAADAKYAAQRENLVTRFIIPEGITNKDVLRAMRTVPRHLFVPANQKALAYSDQALPIGHKQTISPPYIVAYMTEIIEPNAEDKVLEIGTGSGYQAAILGQIVKEVYTIEIVEPLGQAAAQRLKDLKYENIHPKIGDGYQGWPEHAPFDKIIVTCSPEDVPQPLVEQLKEGGKMIIPLGERYHQVFHLLEKKDGKLVRTKLMPTLFVPMTGRSEEIRQVKPDPLKPTAYNGSFEVIIPDSTIAEGWHYQRQMTLMEGGAPNGKYFVAFDNSTPGNYSQCLQGFGVDGRKIGSLRIRFEARGARLQPSGNLREIPAVVVHFYDGERKPLGESVAGITQTDFEWQAISKDLPVPPGAREAILQVGLNGGTGQLCIDNLQMAGRPR